MKSESLWGKTFFLNRFLKIMNELTDSKYFIIFVTYL